MLNNIFELRYLPLFYEELERSVTYIAYALKNSEAASKLLDDVEALLSSAYTIIPRLSKRSLL